MASIYFVGTYKPIKCGIADYTSFITRESPVRKWGVLSFDLDRYEVPLCGDKATADRVWYGIPGHDDFSESVILEGLEKLGARSEDAVLWFQHETGIWPDYQKFVAMLKHLDMPKVVSFHTLHFESSETPSGLRKYQYNLLRTLLPHVEAITVFSYGVYQAVILAFPEYEEKVHVIKHGIHLFPEVARLSRKEAKEKLVDFLLYESELDQETKVNVNKQRIFLDTDTVIIGQTGFLCPSKDSETLYLVRDALQRIPHKRIVAVRIGSVRENAQRAYAIKLRGESDGINRFLIETWLPESMLPVAQRAFDINFYWPAECTQSGILAHALGAGAIVAGRDLEGVGETLKEARALADVNLRYLLMKIRNLILNPELADGIEEEALRYAADFSWKNQAQRHYELAERVLHPMPLWLVQSLPLTADTRTTLVADDGVAKCAN